MNKNNDNMKSAQQDLKCLTENLEIYDIQFKIKQVSHTDLDDMQMYQKQCKDAEKLKHDPLEKLAPQPYLINVEPVRALNRVHHSKSR